MNAGAILSLIATVGAFIGFLLMLQESIALSKGQDPVSNDVRGFARRFPRSTRQGGSSWFPVKDARNHRLPDQVPSRAQQ